MHLYGRALRRRPDMLDQAAERSELNIPGFELHQLTGPRPPRYAISVNGPWRITFEWDRGDAVAVDPGSTTEVMTMTTKADKAERPQRARTHPGEVLREDVLPALGVSTSQAAADMGVSRMTLHGLLKERTRVTPTMALRLGRYCGNGAGIWLRLQDTHDLWIAEREIGDEIARIPQRNTEAA